MNRRSFLGLLPLAPIVGPALAKEAAAGIVAAMKEKPIVAGLSIKFDNRFLEADAWRRRTRPQWWGAIGERGPEVCIDLPKDRDIPITVEDAKRRKAEAEAEQKRNASGAPAATDCIPDDIWPI